VTGSPASPGGTTNPPALRIGILTVSDRASRGEYEDRGGPAIRAYFETLLDNPFEPLARVVPDDIPAISAAAEELCLQHCSIIAVTGGTGPAPRDVTPEAIEPLYEKPMPGFGEAMRAASLKHVPTAILSRQSAGIRRKSLFILLPGSPKAIAECLDAVMPAVPYCIELMEGPILTFRPASHLTAFRPKHAAPKS
jgi:molybdopterin adenylyltransferase